jgi:hypothetical protein
MAHFASDLFDWKGALYRRADVILPWRSARGLDLDQSLCAWHTNNSQRWRRISRGYVFRLEALSAFRYFLAASLRRKASMAAQTDDGRRRTFMPRIEILRSDYRRGWPETAVEALKTIGNRKDVVSICQIDIDRAWPETGAIDMKEMNRNQRDVHYLQHRNALGDEPGWSAADAARRLWSQNLYVRVADVKVRESEARKACMEAAGKACNDLHPSGSWVASIGSPAFVPQTRSCMPGDLFVFAGKAYMTVVTGPAASEFREIDIPGLP